MEIVRSLNNRSTKNMKNLVLVLITIGSIPFVGCGGYREHGTGQIQSQQAEFGSKKHFSAKEHADVYFSLARSAEKQGNLQEAIRLYKATLQKQPKLGEANWRLAICLDKSGNFQESAFHYQSALKLMPGNPEIFCDYGYSLSLQKKWEESEMNLKQSLAIKPDLQRAHNNLGLVLVQGSNLDEARREFQLGGLNLADAHWNLAQMLVSQSRWGEARTEFEKMKAIAPDDASIHKELSSLNRLVAKLDRVQNAGKADSQIQRVAATVPLQLQK
jgi:Flp pilus assembly protein TadD